MTSIIHSFKRPEADLSALELLALKFPNVDAAIAELSRLAAVQTLPKGVVHVISDIHGEDKKLQHVINNASGTLRPIVESMFATTMSETERAEFLKLAFYPSEGDAAGCRYALEFVRNQSVRAADGQASARAAALSDF